MLSIAILGPTGNIGWQTLVALLAPPFARAVSKIVAITHSGFSEDKLQLLQPHLSPATASPRSPAVLSVSTVIDYTDVTGLERAMEGVDLVIDTTNFKDASGREKKASIRQALQKAKVQTYIPSEFGVDWRNINGSHELWSAKQEHQAELRKAGVKVVAVYCGLLLERAFGPWFGMDFPNYVFDLPGSPSTRVSLTSMQDLGKSIASLVMIASEYGNESLPDNLRLAGETLSVADIKATFDKHDSSHREIELKPRNRAEARVTLESGGTLSKYGGPADWITVLLGEGQIDYDDEQDLAFGHETGQAFVSRAHCWKWTTVEEYAESVKGRPWM